MDGRPTSAGSGAGVRSLRITAWIVAVLLAFHLTGLRVEMNLVYPPASIESLMAGSAMTPYQYRILMPAILGWLYDHHVLSRAWLEPREAAMVIEVLALLGAYASLRVQLRDLDAGEAKSSIVALSIFFLLPFQYLLSRAAPFWYVWDAPAVCFFTFGLWCLRQGRWRLYYPLFLLATFNKETTIFLTVVHVLTGWGGTPKLRLAGHAAAQLAIWFLVKLGLVRAYSGNFGMGMVPNVLDGNLAALMVPSSLLLIASSFGFLWIPVLILRRRIEDGFLRRAVIVLVPYFGSAMLSGVITELRIYGELTPLIVLALYAATAREPERAAVASV